MSAAPAIDPIAAGEQVAAFIGAIYDPDQWIELRPIPSADNRSWHLARAVEPIVRECLRLNRQGENVFFGANPRRGRGQAGGEGVLCANSLFADFDGKHLMATRLLEQIAEVLGRIAKAKLPAPSMLVNSGHGIHAWWLFAFPTSDLDEWELILDALVSMLGSCHGAKGRERIMRVPGLVNWKEPVACSAMIECDPNRRFEWVGLADEIRKSIPPLPPAAENVEKVVASHAGRSVQGESVIDVFNQRISITDILEAAGYRIVGRYFRRPGKTDRGFSGIIRTDKHGRLVSAHWSSNDPLNDHRFGGRTCGIHDAFDAFTVLKYGGDTKAAVKAAAVQLGIPLHKQKSDEAVIEEVAAGPDAPKFRDHVWADPQTDADRRGMKAILQKHTSNPLQVQRILELTGAST